MTARPTVYFGGDGATPASRRFLAQAIDAARPDLAIQVGASLPDTFAVIVCATAREFRREAGAVHPNTLAVAQPGRRRIVLGGAALGGDRGSSWLGTLRHELAHLAVHGAAQRGGVFLPRWFDEGVASWFGNRYTELGPAQVERLVNAPWLRLEALEVTFPRDGYRRLLAYEKSVRSIEAIERRRPGTVAELVRGLERGVAVRESIVAELGWSVNDLDERTRESARFAFLRRWLVSGIASPWTLLAFVVLVGYIVRRLRYRRRLRQWEDEELGLD